MNIGGHDTIVTTTLPREQAFGRVVSVLSYFWPGRILQWAAEDHTELFVYQDEAAKKVWVEHGSTDQYRAGLVYLLMGENELTIVWEPPAPWMDAVMERLRDPDPLLDYSLPPVPPWQEKD